MSRTPLSLLSAVPVKAAAVVLLIQGAALNVPAFSLDSAGKVATDRIISGVLSGEYGRAYAQCDSLELLRPEDPLGPLLRLMVSGLRDLDFETASETEGLEGQYQATVRAVAAWEKRHGISSYSLTLLGFAKSTFAAYHLRRKRYMGTIQTGREALDLLGEARKRDPADADAAYFLGLYDCARSELKSRLWWVLFWFPGDRERGIARLETAAESAQIVSLAARLSLIDIYSQTRDWEKALTHLRFLEQRFSNSRFVMWSRAKFHEAREEPVVAAEWYGRLKVSYAATGNRGWYNRGVSALKEASLRAEAGDSVHASAICRELLAACAKEGKPPAGNCREAQKILDRMDRND